MKIYNYHPETKEYLGESEARKSPLEKDVYLIPAYAVDFAPNLEEGKITYFENGQWINKSIPEPETPKEPILEEKLKTAKEKRKNQLKSNRQAFQYSNFVFEENIYKASESAQNKLANKILAASQSNSTLFSWNDAFDEVIALELSEAQELLAGIVEREDSAYSNYTEKLKEIEACTTLEELNNININFN